MSASLFQGFPRIFAIDYCVRAITLAWNKWSQTKEEKSGIMMLRWDKKQLRESCIEFSPYIDVLLLIRNISVAEAQRYPLFSTLASVRCTARRREGSERQVEHVRGFHFKIKNCLHLWRRIRTVGDMEVHMKSWINCFLLWFDRHFHVVVFFNKCQSTPSTQTARACVILLNHFLFLRRFFRGP